MTDVAKNYKATYMTKHKCTLKRAAEVLAIYHDEIVRLGEAASAVSRAYIYEKIKLHTNLSIRTISQMVNHAEDYREDELDE